MKKGIFSLQIINAETKEPMKEFTAADGKVYVEAEPDLEYFLRCSSEKFTVVKYIVDDTELNFVAYSKTVPFDHGIWQYRNGESSHKAFKFVLKPTGATATANQSGTNPFHVGTIKAVFHEAINHGLRESRDWDTEFEGGTATQTGKKAFASVKGSTTTKNHHPKMYHHYAYGQILDEITIHYTSALGFIHLGILPSARIPERNNRQERRAAAPAHVTRIETTNTNDINNSDSKVTSETDTSNKRRKTESYKTTTILTTTRTELIDLT